MKRRLSVVVFLLSALTLGAQLYQPKFYGTLYLATITTDHVNVRNYPSRKGKVLLQLNSGDPIAVTGVSEKAEKIDSKTGYWLRIRHAMDKDALNVTLGWVYSQFVSGLTDIVQTRMTVKKFEPASGALHLSVERRHSKKDVTVSPYRQGSQPFYTFTWSDDDNDFSYVDIPGTYAWYPATGKLVHVSYEGYRMDSEWSSFTDDFKYRLQNLFLPEPNLYGLSVWNNTTSEKVFSGVYYKDINLTGHQIDMAYIYNDENIEQGSIDSETERHAQEFLQKTERPDERSGRLADLLIVIYRLDLDTGMRIFKESKYIPTH